MSYSGTTVGYYCRTVVLLPTTRTLLTQEQQWEHKNIHAVSLVNNSNTTKKYNYQKNYTIN